MSEEYLVRYCSPTLAGIKTGSLFSCNFENEENMRGDMRGLNRMLRNKGLRVLPLKYCDNRALVYVYRPARLRNDFMNKSVREILRKHGYSAEYPERCVAELMKRISENREFPHEIGLFLGYPPEDVRGFIENKARGYKCVGCWKVYGDAEYARRMFAEYKKCTEVYTEQLAKGKSLEKLAVCEQ